MAKVKENELKILLNLESDIPDSDDLDNKTSEVLKKIVNKLETKPCNTVEIVRMDDGENFMYTDIQSKSSKLLRLIHKKKKGH